LCGSAWHCVSLRQAWNWVSSLRSGYSSFTFVQAEGVSLHAVLFWGRRNTDNSFFIFSFVVLGGSTFWHLQRFFQCIKYTIFKITPFNSLPYPHSPGTVSTGIIFAHKYYSQHTPTPASHWCQLIPPPHRSSSAPFFFCPSIL
jgi:hypothetical protein